MLVFVLKFIEIFSFVTNSEIFMYLENEKLVLSIPKKFRIM